MQSYFRLSWCSDQLGLKISDKPALDKMRPTPLLEMPMLNKLKRKCSDSPDVSSLSGSQTPKRLRENMDTTRHHQPNLHDNGSVPVAMCPGDRKSVTVGACEVPAQAAMPVSEGIRPSDLRQREQSCGSQFKHAPGSDADRQAPTMAVRSSGAPATAGLTALQQVIENEFNMQILYKHNELRLIEQELAKCQIALEQLRRCEVRPYPGSDGLSAAVSSGLGPALQPPPGFSRPSHPAPYGVTDGPYSHHYRRWLLQDSQFDPLSPQAVASQETLVSASGRPTRNGNNVRKFSSKAVGSTSRTADPSPGIPNYPTVAVKDKSTPLVLKRSTDGKLVKLICNNCHRGNFSSIQGFLNHCRIAHKVDYKSHDLAAIDCGRPLDEGELASLPTETQATAPKPVVSRSSTSVTHTPARNLVHPLNTAVSNVPGLFTPTSAVSSVATPARSLGSPAPQAHVSSPFKASTHLPHLSAYFAKHQLGGDLEQAASRAKQKTDVFADDELPSPQTPDASSPIFAIAGSRTVGNSALDSEHARPASRKGYRQPVAQRHRPSPLAPSDSFSRGDLFQSPDDRTPTAFLSPHTVDSNPGLVSDHEDDDHGSASEEEATHSELSHPPLPPVSRDCGQHMEIDVSDEISQHGVIIRRNSMLSSDARPLRNEGSPSRKMSMREVGK